MNILLIEDNAADQELVQAALKQIAPEDHLLTVEEGEEALRLLRGEKEAKEGWPPDFVMIDLTLPRKDGIEILNEIRRDKNLKSLTVFILTNSNLRSDYTASKLLGADGYFQKPGNYKEMVPLLKTIRDLALKRQGLPKPKTLL